MDPASNICYIVGAMSLTPDLRPYPAPGDYVIAADRGYDSLMAFGVTLILPNEEQAALSD